MGFNPLLVSSAENTLFSVTHFCPHTPTKQLCPSATIIVLFTARLTLRYAQHDFLCESHVPENTGRRKPAPLIPPFVRVPPWAVLDFLLIVRCQPEHCSENAQD